MLNTVKDMHIYCDLRLQEIYSNRKKTVEPHLLDYYLNKAARVYVETKIAGIKRGIDIGKTIKRTDDLRDIKTAIPLSFFLYDNSKLFTYLPQDYLHYDSAIANVGCNISNIVPNNYYIAIGDTNLEDTTSKNKEISLDGNPILNFDNIPYPQDSETNFIYINRILNSFPYVNSEFKLECYYERFGDEYYKGKFIYVVYPKTNYPHFIQYGGNEYSFKKIEKSKYKLSEPTKENGLDIFPTHDIVDILSNSYYNRNRANKPIGFIEDNKLFMYIKDLHTKFYSDNVTLRYIKYPTPINHATNQICEIRNREEICDECIELIKGDIGDGTLQLTRYNNNKNV